MGGLPRGHVLRMERAVVLAVVLASSACTSSPEKLQCPDPLPGVYRFELPAPVASDSGCTPFGGSQGEALEIRWVDNANITATFDSTAATCFVDGTYGGIGFGEDRLVCTLSQGQELSVFLSAACGDAGPSACALVDFGPDGGGLGDAGGPACQEGFGPTPQLP
jgi:hypothetical protein